MKAHIGADVESGLVHHVHGTAPMWPMSLSIRSMNYTDHQTTASFTVASLASSSMAIAFRSRPPTAHAAVVPVRGAATYRALGR
jgi:hypothetical protein